MDDTVGIAEARDGLGGLVRRVAAGRERLTITDGQAAAVLVSAEELADLEEQLAMARYELRKATGTLETVPHEQVVAEARGESRSSAA